ncbi:MAG: hypothetical protein ACE5GM_04185, partial [bacterium]
TFISVIIISLLILVNNTQAAQPGAANVGITFGTGFYQVVNDPRINAYNHNYGLNLQVFDDTEVGIYREFLKTEVNDEFDDVKVDAHASVQINEIRISRTIIPQLVDVALGFGWASIKASYVSQGVARGSESFEVPVVDLLGRVTAIKVSRDKFDARVYVDLGYRFVEIKNFDVTVAAGETEVLDVYANGVLANLGAAVYF